MLDLELEPSSYHFCSINPLLAAGLASHLTCNNMWVLPKLSLLSVLEPGLLFITLIFSYAGHIIGLHFPASCTEF